MNMKNFVYTHTDVSGYQTKMQYNGFVSYIDPDSVDNSRIFIIDTEL